MSSSRIALTSTIVSSSCCSSPPEEPVRARLPLAVVACGAIGAHVRAAVARIGVATGDVEVHVLPPLLHNRPQAIAGEVRGLARRLQAAGRTVVVAYADCGTYGALDEVCADLGVHRLRGLHCYDVFAGSERIEALFQEEPGTYLLTDFLVRSFHRTVMSELGLDRHPELWADYSATTVASSGLPKTQRHLSSTRRARSPQGSATRSRSCTRVAPGSTTRSGVSSSWRSPERDAAPGPSGRHRRPYGSPVRSHPDLRHRRRRPRSSSRTT